jgi:hypothetical protein
MNNAFRTKQTVRPPASVPQRPAFCRWQPGSERCNKGSCQNPVIGPTDADLARRHLLAGLAAGLVTRLAFAQSPPADISARLTKILQSGKLVLEHYGSRSGDAWERRLGVIEFGARRAARCAPRQILTPLSGTHGGIA